jgi:RND family efflux transporter MFP subunit
LDGGFVSQNEAEQKEAQSESQQAQLLATQARLMGASLEVNDCILRAPFSGEIATRTMDPGGFARPGSAIVSIVDRTTVRVTADAPEIDFDAVAPGTPVALHTLATNRQINGLIARRAPAADPATRTVHFELDVADPARDLPVGTTAELVIEVGKESLATLVPLRAALVRGSQASVFVVDGDRAHPHTFALLGERPGQLFLDPKLAAGTRVVSEGRALLSDGDRVAASLEEP